MGLLSCMDRSVDADAPSERTQLTARLFAANGDSIPKADTLRFVVTVGSRSIDTLVGWDRHSLDLGTVDAGAKIHWQATAWKWNAAKTVRSVVWASKAKDTVAQAVSNTTPFTLQTPGDTTFPAAPEAVPGFVADGTGKVFLPYGTDGSFSFAFKAPSRTAMVKLDDSVLMPVSDSSYAKLLSIPAGTSDTVTLRLQDSLGGVSIRTFVIVRAASGGGVDSTSTATFSPSLNGTKLPNSTDSVAVRVTTRSLLTVDSVVLCGRKMKKGGSDTVWLDTLRGLKVGDTLLTATPYVKTVRGTPTTATVTRQSAPASVDSSIVVTLLTPPKDTNVATGSSLPVSVTVTTLLTVDSVTAGGIQLKRPASGSTWTGLLTVPAGANAWKARAYAAAKHDSSKVVTVTGVTAPALTFSPAGGTYPDTVRVEIGSSGADSLTYSFDQKTWYLYTSKQLFNSNTTLYARAWKSGIAFPVDSQTYTIMKGVTLSNLSIGGYPFTGPFDPRVLNYTTTPIAYSTTPSFVAGAASTGATITYNGSSSPQVPLTGDTTTARIKVKNGTDSLTYVVTLIRAPITLAVYPATGTTYDGSQLVRVGADGSDSVTYSFDGTNWARYTNANGVLLTTDSLFARAYHGGLVVDSKLTSFVNTTPLTLASIGSGVMTPAKALPGVLNYTINPASGGGFNFTPTSSSVTVSATGMTCTYGTSGRCEIPTLTATTTAILTVKNGTKSLDYKFTLVK